MRTFRLAQQLFTVVRFDFVLGQVVNRETGKVFEEVIPGPVWSILKGLWLGLNLQHLPLDWSVFLEHINVHSQPVPAATVEGMRPRRAASFQPTLSDAVFGGITNQHANES